MNTRITSGSDHFEQLQADALVVGVFAAKEDGASEDGAPANAMLDAIAASQPVLGSTIARLIESGEFEGESAQVCVIPTPFEISVARIVLVGLGASGKYDARAAEQAAGTAAKQLAGKQRERIAYAFPQDHLVSAICGAMIACHGQDLYRAEKSLHPPDEVCFLNASEAAVREATILARSINLTRRLINQPPNVTYPESFADECLTVADRHQLSIEVWDRGKLEQENCGALLAVARGSSKPPQLVIMRYDGTHGGDSHGGDSHGGDESRPTLALVGKGVTFDSGGLSLKPTDGMKAMKCDMGGAATVLGAMDAIAGLKLKINVIGLVGLVENLVGADCFKLGDVLTARSGKTIEVLNTDAEGRLVLADVLDVACSAGAEKIVDLATLTGACVVALGMDIAGVMTNDQPLCDQVLAACETTGERGWQLPMDDFFAAQIKSDVADIKNIGSGRWGGAITAAKFLQEFVGETPWVHMDIAGPSFAENANGYRDGGATGRYVQTLVAVSRLMQAE